MKTAAKCDTCGAPPPQGEQHDRSYPDGNYCQFCGAHETLWTGLKPVPRLARVNIAAELLGQMDHERVESLRARVENDRPLGSADGWFLVLMIDSLVERLGQTRGTPDRRPGEPVMDPYYDPDAMGGSDSVGGVKPFEKGQRVRLVRAPRTPLLEERIGELGTVTALDSVQVQVNLDVSGSWWIEPDWLAAVGAV